MGKKKKIISMIVSVAMLVAMFPMIVHADDEPGTFAELQEMIDQNRVYYPLAKNYTATENDECLVIRENTRVILEMSGFSLDRNLSASSESGCVIKVEKNAKLELYNYDGGGKVSYITGGSAVNGGGIYIESQASVDIYDNISVSDNGCTQNGGGIFNKGTLTIHNKVSIVDNNAGQCGEDIYLASGGNIVLAGSSTIKDVYLSQGTFFTFSDSCSSAKIGVSTEEVPSTDPVVFTSGLGTKATKDNFKSNNSSYTIELNDDGELTLQSSGSQTPVEPKIIDCNISLDGRIALNVYVDIGTYTEAEMAGSYMEFVISGDTSNPQEPSFDANNYREKDGKKLYRFSCELSSIQLNSKVDLKFYDSQGENKQLIDSKDGWTADNYLTVLNLTPNDFELAFTNFGYYIWEFLKEQHPEWTAQQYPRVSRSYNTVGTYGSEGWVEVKGLLENYKAQKTNIGNGTTYVDKATFQLEFDKTTALMVYLYVDIQSYSERTLPVTVDGVSYTARKAGTVDIDGDGIDDQIKYRLRIEDIYAQKLGNTYCIEGDCGGEFRVICSPMSYVYSALSNPSASTYKKDAMVSVYWFWHYAQEYCSNQA